MNAHSKILFGLLLLSVSLNAWHFIKNRPDTEIWLREGETLTLNELRFRAGDSVRINGKIHSFPLNKKPEAEGVEHCEI